MKTEKRFVIAFAAVVAACCALCVAGSVLSLRHLRQSQNAAVAQLIANLRAREPEMTDTEMMQILNAEENTLDADRLLRSYGISEDSWTVKSSQTDSAAVAAVSASVCLLCGAACFGVFALYKRRQRKRLDRLVSYLAAVNSGSYDLDLDSNSENADSRLQNEIYKTTVTLREAAQQSSESRQQLKTALSDISHQLKTPLTSIVITTENLLDNPDLPPELRQEFLRDIYQASNHISFLVQSLLTLSKLDADSIVLKQRPEPLKEIFSEVTQNIAVLAELRGVSVTAADNAVTLGCDKKWLCEALTNIVKNCVEHTGACGTVRLTAAANPLYTAITVSDNGQGIAPEDLPHIFERFYRGKNAADDSVGIGLALAKAIIEKAGGTIRAASEAGKGSEFSIKFFHGNL